jgi:hypothetical protein
VLKTLKNQAIFEALLSDFRGRFEAKSAGSPDKYCAECSDIYSDDVMMKDLALDSAWQYRRCILDSVRFRRDKSLTP